MTKLLWVMAGLAFGFPLDADSALLRHHQVTLHLFRSSEPQDKVDLDTIKSAGIGTLIDLREIDSRTSPLKQLARENDFEVLEFPISLKDALLGIEPAEHTVRAALEVMANAGPKNQLLHVHCEGGKDRTGLLIGLYRVFYQAWTPEAAHAEMLSLDYNPRLWKGLETFFWRKVREGL